MSVTNFPGSCAHDDIDSSEIFSITGDWIYQTRISASLWITLSLLAVHITSGYLKIEHFRITLFNILLSLSEKSCARVISRTYKEMEWY